MSQLKIERSNIEIELGCKDYFKDRLSFLNGRSIGILCDAKKKIKL
jgi:hypothetical protein